MQVMRFSIFCLLIFSFCSKKNATLPVANNNNTIDTDSFIRGADISWTTEMENAGRKFYDSTGVARDIITILKMYRINTIRLRVFVNPANGWCNANDVLNKALLAKAAGMKILINFHYSDSWADPGKQTKPAAWQLAGFNVLKDSMHNHTFQVLNLLKRNNITPDWVQIGNETNDGLLWPDGKASTNMANFAELIKTGCNAAKAVFPSIKLMVHISNGYDNNLFRWIFDGLKSNNVEYDIIGMSLYPSPTNWQTLNNQCLLNMNDMVARYNKKVMIVETGMSWDEATACRMFITDLITKTKQINNKSGLGLMYWEPQSYNWQGYTLGCFDMSGKPTIALNGFR